MIRGDKYTMGGRDKWLIKTMKSCKNKSTFQWDDNIRIHTQI